MRLLRFSSPTSVFRLKKGFLSHVFWSVFSADGGYVLCDNFEDFLFCRLSFSSQEERIWSDVILWTSVSADSKSC